MGSQREGHEQEGREAASPASMKNYKPSKMLTILYKYERFSARFHPDPKTLSKIKNSKKFQRRIKFAVHRIFREASKIPQKCITLLISLCFAVTSFCIVLSDSLVVFS